jgi:hypothetical protein
MKMVKLQRLCIASRLLLRTGLILCLSWSSAALAHKSSDSYLHLTAQGEEVLVQWDIALRDLDAVLDLDANADGQLSWGEVRQRQQQISEYAQHSLEVSTGGIACSMTPSSLLIDTHTDGSYAVLNFTAACARSIADLQVGYGLFAGVDAGHRGLLDLQLGSRVITQVLLPGAAAAVFTALESATWAQFSAYLRTGVGHIWSGYDHLLFLFCLLLPAVLLRRNGRWEAQDDLRAAFIAVCKVVTAFTIAHSLTLGLATLGVVRIPSRVSESAIALTVILAALNNVVPLVRMRLWLMAFCFGLLHGFGFANVLTDLELPRPALALALTGFNLGVELGQLAIVALFLPVVYLARRTLFYRRFVLQNGSAAIALLGALWLAERVFNLEFLPVH